MFFNGCFDAAGQRGGWVIDVFNFLPYFLLRQGRHFDRTGRRPNKIFYRCRATRRLNELVQRPNGAFAIGKGLGKLRRVFRRGTVTIGEPKCMAPPGVWLDQQVLGVVAASGETKIGR